MGETLTVVFAPKELDMQEADRLARLESSIEKNLAAFYAVGLALAEIKQDRLYRENYDTFEAYCRDRYSLARRTAYQYIESAATVDNLKECAQLEHKPTLESHLRPLNNLTPEDQRTAWLEVEAAAQGDRITAALVQRVVKQVFGEQAPKAGPQVDQDTAEIIATIKANLKALTIQMRAASEADWKDIDRTYLKRSLSGLQRMLED